MQDELLTAEEVSKILRVPTSWIYAHGRELPCYRIGRLLRFRRSEIEAWLADQQFGHAKTPGITPGGQRKVTAIQ